MASQVCVHHVETEQEETKLRKHRWVESENTKTILYLRVKKYFFFLQVNSAKKITELQQSNQLKNITWISH